MEAKLLGIKSEAYGPTHMRRKRKDCFKAYISHFATRKENQMKLCSVSKLLHEFHLESGKKDKNQEKLVIRTATTVQDSSGQI